MTCFVGPTVRSRRSSGQLEQLRPRELHVEVLRALGDERQVDLRRHRRRELDLRLLGGVVEPLQRHGILRQVGAVVLLELRDEPVDDGLVEVVAAEVVVTRRRLHMERPVAELEHGHVERAAAEVEDEDRLVRLLVEPVRERGGRGLVDDAKDVEAGDLAGVLRRLALRVVEVRRDGDDGVGDLFAEIRLRVRLELLKDHGRDLRRRVLLAVRLYAHVLIRALRHLVGDDRHLLRDLVDLPAHEALDREDGVLRVRHLLPLRRSADEPLAVLRERDYGRRRAPALGVRNDGRLAAFDRGHARVGRAQVDADHLAHSLSPSMSLTVEENLSLSVARL